MEVLRTLWSGDAWIANLVIGLHLLAALVLGLLVGYERAFHGRAAGLRTYAMVAVASTALTVVNGYPQHWYGGLPPDAVQADASRVIQGIVTGIGFLGAGVIMKEGFTIRGLSTAASIWTMAAIGVVLGLGFYAAAVMATLLAIIVMGGFKRLEEALPHRKELHLSVAFRRQRAVSADELTASLRQHGIQVVDLACRLSADGARFEYDLRLLSSGPRAFSQLVDGLSKSEEVIEFRLSPLHE